MNPKYQACFARVATMSTKVILATGLFAGTMALSATLARADEASSLEGKIANLRLVNQISDALSTYTHAVDARAQTTNAQLRADIDTESFTGYRHVVWLVSALQSSATEAETDEFNSVQEMVGVYHEMDDKVAADAAKGDLARASHDAAVADGIASEIRTSLNQIADRNYTGLYEAVAMRADRPVKAAEMVHSFETASLPASERP